jgi:hypothetical protein
MGGDGQHDTKATLHPVKSRGTHGGWYGTRSGLDVFGEEKNMLFLPIFEP